MANPHLSTTLETFVANVHRTKNRLISIPAASQRRLGLSRRANNHIVLFSLRAQGKGRWNHHLAYLTFDNEFAIPADVTGIKAGDEVEIKIHRVIPDADALAGRQPVATAGGPSCALPKRPVKTTERPAARRSTRSCTATNVADAPVFVDTGYFVALLNRRDDLHERARKLAEGFAKDERRLLTTDAVLVELANFFARSSLRGLAVSSIQRLA